MKLPLMWIASSKSLVCALFMVAALGCSAENSETASSDVQATEGDKPITLAKANTGQGPLSITEGQHYKKVNEDGPKVGPLEKVKVTEFFSFGCGHCFNLEAGLKSWVSELPTYVEFDHMPAFWNETYALLAQAHYTIEVLGVEEKLRQPIFDAIHKRGLKLRSAGDIKDLLVQNGVEAAKFDKTFNSFAVKQKMKMADNAFREYKLSSVPVFVVGGQYVTSVSDAGGEENLWTVLNHLTAKVKSGEL